MFSKSHIRNIDANRTLKDILTNKLKTSRSRSRISVTDLLNPTQSFYRWKHPEIKPSLDRVQLMLSGTGFHDVFGSIISTEEYLEQTLEYEGIIGKVDIYEDFPIEIKTTSSIPTDLIKQRISYFEQLGMYCHMANSEVGRLIIYSRANKNKTPSLAVYDIDFLDLKSIKNAMILRRDLFKNALSSNNPSLLPRCEWFHIGCDYKHVCHCSSAASLEPIVSKENIVLKARDDVVKDLTKLIVDNPKAESNSTTTSQITINDLVFPRKSFLKKSDKNKKSQEPESTTKITEIQNFGFKYALYNALSLDTESSYKEVPINLESLDDTIQIYDGSPYILRTVKFDNMIQREKLPQYFPHFFDRLAIECALSNNRKGRLILYYEAIKGDKFMVYDVFFHGKDFLINEITNRIKLLEESTTTIKELPGCPTWMYKKCEFAPNCQCDSTQ